MVISKAVKKHIDSLIVTNQTIQRYNKDRYNEVTPIGKKYVAELTAINELRIEAGIKFLYHV